MTTFVGILGLVVGFLAGIAFRDALDLYRASRKEHPMSPTRNHTLNRWILTGVLIVNLCLGVVLIVQRATSEDFTACTSRWQTDFLAAYKARSNPAARTQKALDQLLDQVKAGDQTGFQRELRQYQNLRAKQIAKREATPLPKLPEQVCGEPAR